MKIFFVDFLSGFAGIFIPVRQKKSLKISFFMEKGMVCEKEKLAGMTASRISNRTLRRVPLAIVFGVAVFPGIGSGASGSTSLRSGWTIAAPSIW